jgi:hypothetical protein
MDTATRTEVEEMPAKNPHSSRRQKRTGRTAKTAKSRTAKSAQRAKPQVPTLQTTVNPRQTDWTCPICYARGSVDHPVDTETVAILELVRVHHATKQPHCRAS